MAISTQLYRFRIELADISRAVYESLDFRVAQHPSESMDFLLTRVLAYALNFENGLSFSAEGLHNPDNPCLHIPSPFGGERLWIEVGSPSARKVHKASKASEKVKIYTYKNPTHLTEEIRRNNVHRASELEIFSIDTNFLEQLSGTIERDNTWSLTHEDTSLLVTTKNRTLQSDLVVQRV